MRPTLRGYGLVVVVLVGIALGAAFGARSLNAIVVPGLVALGAGAVQLWRADPPALERSQPDPGFPGETHSVTLTIASAVPCEVVDSLGEGLVADETRVRTAGDGQLTYEVTYEHRGEHRLGPATVTATDALGLFARQFTYAVEATALVYPTVRRLGQPVALAGGVEAAGRGAFDRIREYVPGDSLRDIHWRSSAKHPRGELVVAEYAADEHAGVTIAAETAVASGEAADAMASATASVALGLLESGIAVGVDVPGGRLPERTGRRHRRELCALLARASSGGLASDARERADVRLVADADGVRVIDAGRQRAFADLVVGEARAPA